MWGEEDGHGVSTAANNSGSAARLFDFVVAKTNDQEENVAARQGFTVIFLIKRSFSALI